jgi:putative endonuclease
MSHFVYILYSTTIGKYSVGKTEYIENRLAHHNSENKRIWTRRGQSWMLKKLIGLNSSIESSKTERFIKKQKSRRFIEKINLEGWSIWSRSNGKGP